MSKPTRLSLNLGSLDFVRAIGRFIVQPALPSALSSLAILSKNLRWSWDQETQEVFASIDQALWESCGKNPLKLLSQVSYSRLEELAADRIFMRHLVSVEQDLNEYLSGDLWYQSYSKEHADAPTAIGYFSAEFGVASALPQYSGGLGILAGDHLKSASDLGVPVIGVGLLYQHGYFRQSLDANGWQQEHYPVLDPQELPIERVSVANPETGDSRPLVLEVTIRGERVQFAIWKAAVGRVPLLLLDTNLDTNSPTGRSFTDRLYGGGSDHRLAQEVLLGIGGIRAVNAYCELTSTPVPEVFHCNEGHAGFLSLERIRDFMVSGDSYDVALVKTRASTVFTTHTPVPAGIDRFTQDQMIDQFGDFSPLALADILALGTEAEGDKFNMAIMGLRLANRANGVSELHGEVSRRMFASLWPGFDESEVPITSVTNGVHHQTWLQLGLFEILTARTTSGHGSVDGLDWDALDRITDHELWELRNQFRRELVMMARERLTASEQQRGRNPDWTENALDSRVLTIGFARRAASYKRLTLMLTDPDRFKALLNHPTTPVQFVIAGKSHPADEMGKGLIQQMVQFTDDPDVRGKIVFLPDYDISLAQPLYPGCDVWLNNPIRPYEACGTSGMKAALNGVANLSVKDGWWDEWFDPAWGWELTSAEAITDLDLRNQAEAEELYSIIEDEIIPRFYTRDSSGLPKRWVQMIRETITGLGPKVLASRMVRDYVTDLYTPASADGRFCAENAEELASWIGRIRRSWPQVTVSQVISKWQPHIEVGGQVRFSCQVALGELDTSDVTVQLILGDVDTNDELHNLRIHAMQPEGQGDAIKYTVDVTKSHPGSIGYTVRVVPRHDGLNPVNLGLATLAG